ncbi:hypothetical protein O7543_19080 [Solwaraspora sp. WMMA2080]|uniref:hypothetical protein n=1 Tax=unclassified Solwaraspora TaxID=2627926 RepID=UPI00248C3D77|nr:MULTISPECIES: hypothetical protein [unclassified Solwaraspora]WBB97115.1 hypothetical protein O7553_28290 [Solwaraspora sp. WMMA2059]WBC18983.1 hypothetical protein O7543_19080 [Solwaraspora sp. WMMA2080]
MPPGAESGPAVVGDEPDELLPVESGAGAPAPGAAPGRTDQPKTPAPTSANANAPVKPRRGPPAVRHLKASATPPTSRLPAMSRSPAVGCSVKKDATPAIEPATAAA